MIGLDRLGVGGKETRQYDEIRRNVSTLFDRHDAVESGLDQGHAPDRAPEAMDSASLPQTLVSLPSV